MSTCRRTRGSTRTRAADDGESRPPSGTQNERSSRPTEKRRRKELITDDILQIVKAVLHGRLTSCQVKQLFPRWIHEPAGSPSHRQSSTLTIFNPQTLVSIIVMSTHCESAYLYYCSPTRVSPCQHSFMTYVSGHCI